MKPPEAIVSIFYPIQSGFPCLMGMVLARTAQFGMDKEGTLCYDAIALRNFANGVIELLGTIFLKVSRIHL